MPKRNLRRAPPAILALAALVLPAVQAQVLAPPSSPPTIDAIVVTRKRRAPGRVG